MMPTYITVEQYTCGHAAETNATIDDDGRNTIVETTTLPGRCLSCVCHSLLDSLLDGLQSVPRSTRRELETHLRALEQHPLAQRCKLEDLSASALRPSDAVEFRRAVTALAGLPELGVRFGM